MQLAETVVAAAIMTVPITASLQLQSMHQAQQTSAASRSELLSKVDQDRMQLQNRWQALRPLGTSPACVSTGALINDAAAITLSAPLQRRLEVVLPRAVKVSWIANGQTLRQRVYTAEGLGLCQ
ncbi:MAG: hypothetical protein RLZZ611_78 [Cyanobacteriota bacterium]